MRRQWEMRQTSGAPTKVRTCPELAALLVENRPNRDLCDALPQVDGYNLGAYAKNEFAAVLARALERSAGAIDLSRLGSAFRQEKRERRIAIVQGDILIADGRSDPELFGGHARLLHDFLRWKAGELNEPIQLKRLRELDVAGVDVVEFSTNAAVDLRFARINLAQPVVICRDRFRDAVATGRVRIRWS
jgi:hypothetical protein